MFSDTSAYHCFSYMPLKPEKLASQCDHYFTTASKTTNFCNNIIALQHHSVSITSLLQKNKDWQRHSFSTSSLMQQEQRLVASQLEHHYTPATRTKFGSNTG